VIWDLKVPGTTKVFGWRVMLDRLPSRVNLRVKGFWYHAIFVHFVKRKWKLLIIYQLPVCKPKIVD